VSGGKKTKACGRAYFIADTTVNLKSRRGKFLTKKYAFSGNPLRCCNILQLNEHERVVSGISIGTILLTQNVPNWLVAY